MDQTLLNLYDKLEDEVDCFVSMGPDSPIGPGELKETLNKIRRRKSFIVRNYSPIKKGGETYANNSRAERDKP